MITTPHLTSTLSRAAARKIGRDAAIYGYPFVEMLRLCRSQTVGHADIGHDTRVPINALRWWEAPLGWPPAVFVSAWLQLSEGPCRLRFPGGRRPLDQSLLLSLYDACSENFARIGSNDATGYDGELILIGPHAREPDGIDPRNVLRCPTNLMWFTGRVPGTDALATEIEISSLRRRSIGRRPAAVDLWHGAPVDVFRTILSQGGSTTALTAAFFSNLSNSLAHIRIADIDRPLLQRFREAGLWPGPASDRGGLSDDACRGLGEGLEDAVQLMHDYVEFPQHYLPLGLQSADTVGGRHIARAAAAFRGIGMGPGEPFAATLPVSGAAL